MTQLSIAAAAPEPTPELAQWFTDPKLAAELVGLGVACSTTPRTAPTRCASSKLSAGRGNLVRAVRSRAPGASSTRWSSTRR